MRLTFIGRGGMFAPLSVGHSNMLFEEDGKKLLFDFGSTAYYILPEMGISLHDLDCYVSHDHKDHADLEHFAFFRYFVPNSEGKIVKPKLYIASQLVHPLWNKTLSGGLESIAGKTMEFKDYFDIHSIPKNKYFIWCGIKMTPIQVTHVKAGNVIKPSFGLFIENPKSGKNTFITSDCVYSPDELFHWYEKADYIYHDIETMEQKSRVHANVSDMLGLPEEIRKKIWGYHYSEKKHEDQFAGFVEKGQIFEI